MHKPKPYKPDLWHPKNRAERREARRKGYWGDDYDNLPEPVSTKIVDVRAFPTVFFDDEQADGSVILFIGKRGPFRLTAAQWKQVALDCKSFGFPLERKLEETPTSDEQVPVL